MKKILVCGGGGFIGHHLIKKLKSFGHYVIGVDLKCPEFENTTADEFFILDMRDPTSCSQLIKNDIDEIYQLAADMGGAEYIFTSNNDANIMHNSALINLNILNECRLKKIKKIFYSSSACVYSEHNQLDPTNPNCQEDTAYPANPDSEYGWEKLFSERLYLTFAKNYKINVRIARFHNIFGPLGTYKGGREKAPAAICRKIIEATDSIDIWGDGNQSRSFLYIDECIEGIIKIMNSDYNQPINLGSDRLITINELVTIVSQIAGKNISINHIDGPTGVRGRNSDNKRIIDILGWAPKNNLEYGLEKTYNWINSFYKS